MARSELGRPQRIGKVAETDPLRVEVGNRAADALMSASTERNSSSKVNVWEEVKSRELSNTELGERVTTGIVFEEVAPKEIIKDRAERALWRAEEKGV